MAGVVIPHNIIPNSSVNCGPYGQGIVIRDLMTPEETEFLRMVDTDRLGIAWAIQLCNARRVLRRV